MERAAKLIVLVAFDENDDGELGPAFEPKALESESKAIAVARGMVKEHAGVIAWSRVVDPDEGKYSEPVVLFRSGKIPDME